MKEWLAYEYRKKASREECMKLSVYERRFRLNVFREIDEGDGENTSETKTKDTGKGKRTKQLSPEELKQELKNNPNNFV